MSGATIATGIQGGGNSNANATGSNYAAAYGKSTTSLIARGYVKHKKKIKNTKPY
jgi:hypothetical protein